MERFGQRGNVAAVDSIAAAGLTLADNVRGQTGLSGQFPA